MTLFSCYQIRRSTHDRTLFDDVSFGMESGEKIGIIGRNGVGKSTLLKVVAKVEPPDAGSIVWGSGARVVFVPQLPDVESFPRIVDAVMNARRDLVEGMARHAELCKDISLGGNSQELEKLTQWLDHEKAWELDVRARTFAAKLGLDDAERPVNTLSGGQKKRVALASALLAEPDLLILDEPTNHLDADSVQWLQDFIQTTPKGVLLVTHDRYFLDAVSTRIIEIDRERLFSYPGSWEEYLERKATLLAAEDAEAEHRRSTLRKELAWLQRGAKARRKKQKSRIDWIAEMSDAPKRATEKNIEIEVGGTFLGSKIIEAHNIYIERGGRQLLNKFTYIASPGDRIGIIGPNGAGKSSLLEVLANITEPSAGVIKFGDTVKIGYFRQENTKIDPNQTVIGALREIAEYIDTGVGRERYLSVRDMLTKFLFPPSRQHSLVSTLSGGERRRLELVKVLMGNPNVLLMDEPTNDFDIPTLEALEGYLENFKGVLIVVSHDRAFLDKVAEFIYAFEGTAIRPYPGNYSVYLDRKEEEEKRRREAERQRKEEEQKSATPAATSAQAKPKASYKQKKEFEELEKEIHTLEAERDALSAAMLSGSLDHANLAEAGKRLTDLELLLEGKMERWMELGEMM